MVSFKQSEAVRDTMKNYVDPRTGTVSFSGADMTGVIFLPMSTNQLISLIQKKEFDLELMRADFEAARGARDTLSSEWSRYNSAYDTANESYLYYKGLYEGGQPEYEDEMNSYLQQRNVALVNRQAVELQLERLDPKDYLNLADKISAASLEVRRLQNLLSAGGKYTRPIKLLDLQTVSISSHREKFPVRTLGRVHPKSYTRGPRTLAGSFIFTLFNKAALWDLLQATQNFYSSGVGVGGTDSGYPELNTVLADQLPPFDLTIICSNELGDNSYMVLYGIEIVNDGQTLSIQDIITENVMQFVARDFEPMRPLTGRRKLLERNEPFTTPDGYVTKYKSERERRGIRLNPFV